MAGHAVADAEHLLSTLLKFLVAYPLYHCALDSITLLSLELLIHLLSAVGFKFIMILLMLLCPRRLTMVQPAPMMKVQRHLIASLGKRRILICGSFVHQGCRIMPKSMMGRTAMRNSDGLTMT